jgi:hypothetical protein
MGDFVHKIEYSETAKTNPVAATAAFDSGNVVLFERNRNTGQDTTKSIDFRTDGFVQIVIVFFGPIVPEVYTSNNKSPLFAYFGEWGHIAFFGIGYGCVQFPEFFLAEFFFRNDKVLQCGNSLVYLLDFSIDHVYGCMFIISHIVHSQD